MRPTPIITYIKDAAGRLNVYLDGKRVGRIVQDAAAKEWYYQPNGQSHRGESFKSLAAVKRSLE